jgi:hypothetical protein
MGGVEYYHWRMMGCAAPHHNDGNCYVVPWYDEFYVQCHTTKIAGVEWYHGGGWDVQCHTTKIAGLEWCHGGGWDVQCHTTRIAGIEWCHRGGWDVQRHIRNMGVIELYPCGMM